MSKRVLAFVQAAFVGFLSIAGTMFGASRHAAFAADCLAGPTREPAPGGHWYFHLDRASDHKCWYLVEPVVRGPTADATESQPPAEAPPQPGFGSFFSLMGLPSAPVGAPPDTTGNTGNVGRNGDPARPDDSRNPTAASPRPRHPDAQANLTPKPRRPPPARPPAEHADEQPASPPDQAERDALFQEFLRWRDRNTP
jgi:hypothetical protein